MHLLQQLEQLFEDQHLPARSEVLFHLVPITQVSDVDRKVWR